MSERIEQSALTETVYYILLSLFEPMHGYGIMQKIKELSDGRINMGAGTLYGAINTLLEKGWIIPIASGIDSRKKEYKITEVGKQIIKGEILRLEELIINGKNAIGGI